jgi:hypothetical protein
MYSIRKELRDLHFMQSVDLAHHKVSNLKWVNFLEYYIRLIGQTIDIIIFTSPMVIVSDIEV